MLLRIIQAPFFFSAGWLFNYFVDIRFAAGFASGWLAHSWLGDVLAALSF